MNPARYALGPLPGNSSKLEMLWKPIQSNKSFIGRNHLLRFSTRGFLLSAFFLVGLPVFFCSPSVADDDVSVDSSEVSSDDLSLDDLDPELRTAVVDLAVAMTGGEKAASATVEDNVAAILSLLQSVLKGIYQGQSFATVPYSVSGSSLSVMRHLAQILVDSSYVNLAGNIPQSSSYIYEIQRALYGQTGVPNADQAVIPVLLALSGVQRSAFGHITNDTGNLTYLSSIDQSIDGVSTTIGSYLPMISDQLYTEYSLVDYLFNSLFDRYSSLSNAPHYYDADAGMRPFQGMSSMLVTDPGISSTWIENVADYSTIPISAIHVRDPATAAEITGALNDLRRVIQGDAEPHEVQTNDVRHRILQKVSDISDTVDDIFVDVDSWRLETADYWDRLFYHHLGYDNENRTIAIDFERVYSALTNVSSSVIATRADGLLATNEFASVTNDVAVSAAEYESSFQYSVGSMTNTLESASPDSVKDQMEVSYTENPMIPLAGAVDFSSKFRAKLPNPNSIQTSPRVHLFKTEWDQNHLLTSRGLGAIQFDLGGTDPYVPNTLLEYASRMMAWAWNVACLVVAFGMLRDFWNWCGSWRA